MRAVGSLLFVVALFAACADYDCEAKCRELEDEIHEQVTNPGDDPCSREAIVTATTCDACEQAFVNEFGLSPDPGFCQ